jgi:hypothetical protein
MEGGGGTDGVARWVGWTGGKCDKSRGGGGGAAEAEVGLQEEGFEVGLRGITGYLDLM